MRKCQGGPFFHMRPAHVMPSKNRVFRQCLCDTCVNPMLKIRQTETHNRAAHQDSCAIFSRDCVERTCILCGVEQYCTSLRETLEQQEKLDHPVAWRKWEKIEDELGKRKDLVQKKGVYLDLVQELQDGLVKLAVHRANALRQRKQYQALQENTPSQWVVATMDFAENYLCVYQDEVQSAHQGYRQITIHPVVLHYRCHWLQNVTEYMIFLTDDMQDGNMVKAITDRVLQHTKQKGLKHMVIFSDGCGAQYKSRLPFYHLLQLQSTSMTVEKAFFGSNHGKSLCDASGGVIKSMAKRAVINGRTIIQNASDLFAFCDANLVLPSADGPNRSCVHTMRSFVKLDSCDMDKGKSSSQIKTVKGTMKVHSVQVSSNGSLMLRDRACFCAQCLDGSPACCPNKEFVGDWQHIWMDVTARATPWATRRRSAHSAQTATQSATSQSQTAIPGTDPVLGPTPAPAPVLGPAPAPGPVPATTPATSNRPTFPQAWRQPKTSRSSQSTSRSWQLISGRS